MVITLKNTHIIGHHLALSINDCPLKAAKNNPPKINNTLRNIGMRYGIYALIS
jgi:hypothetical protein